MSKCKEPNTKMHLDMETNNIYTPSIHKHGG